MRVIRSACPHGPRLSSQRYCRQCGVLLHLTAPSGLGLGLDGTSGAAAALPVFRLPPDEEPLSWGCEGDEVVLVQLQHEPDRGVVAQFAVFRSEEESLRLEPLALAMDTDALRGFVVTRCGVFAADHQLRGALKPTSSGRTEWSHAPANLTPGDHEVVGLSTAASGEVFALTLNQGRLTLWAGAGGRPLRALASAGSAPEAASWMRLFVVSDRPGSGFARFWGGGRAGHVDIELGAMSVRSEVAAPDEPIALKDRHPDLLFDHRPAETEAGSLLPVRLNCPASWGVMRMSDGACWPAPGAAAQPVAIAASGGAVICQRPNAILVLNAPASPKENLKARRLELNLRVANRGVAVALRGQGIVALDADDGDVVHVVLREFGLGARKSTITSPEARLGGAHGQGSVLSWLPPLVADGHLWLATGSPVAFWRLPLE